MSHLIVVVSAILLSFGSLSFTLSNGSTVSSAKSSTVTERSLYFNPYGNSSVPLVIETSSRPAHQIVSNILCQLLTEKLHYKNVTVKQVDRRTVEEVVASFHSGNGSRPPEAMVNVEVWQPLDFNNAAMSPWNISDAGPLGPSVSTGLFIPREIVRRFWDDRKVTVDNLRFFEQGDGPSKFHLRRLSGRSYDTVKCSRNSDCASLVFLSNDEGYVRPVAEFINRTGVRMYPLVVSDPVRLEAALNSSGEVSNLPLVFSVSPSCVTVKHRLVKVTTSCDVKHYFDSWCKQFQQKRMMKWVWNKMERFAPYAYKVIQNLYFSEVEYERLLLQVAHLDKRENGEEMKKQLKQIAKDWIEANPAIWRGWLPKVPRKTTLTIATILPNRGTRKLEDLSEFTRKAAKLVSKNYPFALDAVQYNVDSDDLGSILHAYNQIVTGCNHEHPIVGIMAATWSDVSIQIADLSSKYKIPIISPTAVTLNKKDANHNFPYFFRIIHDHSDYPLAVVKYATFFKWKRIALFRHNSLLVTPQRVSPLKVLVDFQMEEQELVKVENTPALDAALKKAVKKRSRIFVIDYQLLGTSKILCQAAKLNMTANRGYVWILGSWVWGYRSKNFIYEMKNLSLKDCNAPEIDKMFLSLLFVIPVQTADTMTNIFVIEDLFDHMDPNKWMNSHFHLYHYIYESLSTFARALTKLIGSEVERYIYSEGDREKYTRYISETNFSGLTGTVRFSNDNVRVPQQWTLYQIYYQMNHSANETVDNPYPLNIFIELYTTSLWDSKEPKMSSVGMKLDNYPGEKIPSDGSVMSCDWPLFLRYVNQSCETSKEISIGLMGGSATLAFILVTVLIFMFMRWYIKKMNSRFPQPFAELQEALSEYEIPRSALLLQYPLGEGAFGTVYYGEMKTDGNWTGIAAKVLREGASSQERREFLCEALKMCNFNHMNVMTIIGVVTSEPHYVNVMEFMLLGDLRKYLLTRHHVAKTEPDAQDIRPQTLTGMALDIARGLEYLQHKKLVHRDLACRNCLVDKEYHVKIGDFGMTREVDDRKAYYRFEHPGILPVRWMAPESIQSGLFNFHTDIWSYGVVLYEMVTFGNQPYRGRTNEEVIDAVKRYSDSLANYLVKPEERIPELFEMMRMCWSVRPEERPLMSYLIRRLEVNPECVRPCLDEAPPDPGEARPRGIDRCASMFGDAATTRHRGLAPARITMTGSRSSCERTRFASGNRVDTDLRHCDSAGRVNSLASNSLATSIASRLGFLKDTPSSKWYSGGAKAYRHTCSQEFLSYSRHHSGEQEISTVSDPHAYQVEYDPLMFVTVQSMASNAVANAAYTVGAQQTERGSSSGGPRDEDELDTDQQTLLKSGRA